MNGVADQANYLAGVSWLNIRVARDYEAEYRTKNGTADRRPN